MGVVSRLDEWLHNRFGLPYLEAALHTWFGCWAARELRKDSWDAVVCLSGVGEETFLALAGGKAMRICHRSSAHIRSQARLLEEEERRTQALIERPSVWRIRREEREYDLADRVYVPSGFVKETFVAEGFPAQKVDVIPHGVHTAAFRPLPDVIEARCKRILSRQPLRVLNVGTFSLRKGMWDMAQVIRTLKGRNFQFRFIGPVAAEARELASRLRSDAVFTPKQPQRELSTYYAWADLFILPTIEDGFPVVLAQASAAGIPILTTPNGAGRDLVRPGENGWILPVRKPAAFTDCLQWCDGHREELAMMVRRIYQEFRPRDWADVATEFEALYAKSPREVR